MDINILIEAKDLYDHFLVNKNRLIETMDIVACSDTDDFNEKCHLFITCEDGEAFLSLEGPNEIIESETINERTAKETCLEFIEKLRNIE